MTVLLGCSKCGEQKRPDDFYTAHGNTNRHQRHSWCKDCVKDDRRRDRRENPERFRAHGRRHQRRKRLAKYGLTEAAYDAMLAGQGGVCAICGRPETTLQPHQIDGATRLAIDHDHATGKVRGLLCFMCNTAIGKLRDDPALLRAAADYLERVP